MHKHRMQKRGDKEKPVKEKVHIKMHSVTCHLRDCVSSGGAPTMAGTSIFTHMQSVKLKHNGIWEWDIYGLKWVGQLWQSELLQWWI